jgi:hypothetical protein
VKALKEVAGIAAGMVFVAILSVGLDAVYYLAHLVGLA